MANFYFVLVFFLHLFMASSSFAMTSSNLLTDQSTLLDFKEHITDPLGFLANNWSISNPVCNWVGIFCNTRHGRVTSLQLPSMNLSGTVPPHLGNLSFLAHLNIQDNNFHGHLPNELARLRRLRVIWIADNHLSGDLPLWIGNLSLLQDVDISNNGFTGTIPHSLFNLSKLEFLFLSLNKIQGNIPSEIGKLTHLKWLGMEYAKLSGLIPATVYNISSLQKIALQSNNLSGSLPNDICNRLPNLDLLYLGFNELSGKLPAGLGDCSELRDLSLMNNKFTGEIPDKIGHLPNLEYLFLSFNRLTGLIPPTIFNISTINVIELNANDLSGQLPSSIGHSLPNLKELYLSKNKLSGEIPNSITNASKLEIIGLISNSFSGLIPKTFGNLRYLRMLFLADNYLTTESSTAEWSFLSSLTNCRNLKHIALEQNPLYGILPSSIGNFSSSLQRFQASSCKLKGGIPKEIGNLHGLIDLEIDNNDLNRSIPKTLGELQNLQGLQLQNNNMKGSIPNYLCHLQRLTTLYLYGNKLSGRIPTCLENLTSLRRLHLGSNNFTSNIPSSLWTLTYILAVNLSSNSLSGYLSANVQNLKVVEEIDFSKNQLSGDIPDTIGGLEDLKILSFASNKFEGHIPISVGLLLSLENLDLSNNNLSGEIPKSLEALSYLKSFNVSVNRLEGEIPTKGPFRNFSAESFMLNYALCGSTRLQVPPCKNGTNKGSKRVFGLVLKYALPPIMLIIMVMMIIIFIRYRKRSVNSLASRDSLPLATWRRTSYLEIQQATDDFSECNLLGRGSFGSVYKGIFSDAKIFAIKVFNLQIDDAFKSFDSECEILRHIRHRNLIKVFSSCCSPDFKALVLEFISNGSLEKWLYSHNYFLDILERLNIMIDTASALEYLHHDHSTPIVHCDLKPNNILIDESMVGHVSDFGISKLLGEGDSMTQTMTLATIGYMAPEYGEMGIVSPKGDVYSYGILLLEVFTRKKPTDEMFGGGMSLKQWVKNSLPDAVTEVADANLLQEQQSAFSTKVDCILSVMNLALECCVESPQQRINMKDAVAKLQKIKMKFVNDVEPT